MSISSSADHFFQTSTSLAEVERKQHKSRNTHGNPISFSTKLLAVELNTYLDATGDTVFVAEAGGVVSAFRLSSSTKTRIGDSTQAPITCLATYGGPQTIADSRIGQHVFSGDWNRIIRDLQVDLEPQSNRVRSLGRVSFKAHTDFVKCLLVARTPDGSAVLLSGGADGELNVWSFAGHRYTTIKPQNRGIESIAIDPLSDPKAPVIFFSTSQREIYKFELPRTDDMRKGIALSEPIIEHETSVYKLFFDADGDLWTASADKTAKRLVRENGFKADTVLAHPDFVRDITIYEPSSLAVTACRDEEIRVWNTGSGQLVHTFSGHYEEVTGLALSGSLLVSVSIDATLRRWSLAPQDLKEAIAEAKNPKQPEDEPVIDNDFGLSAEEEAELQALMAD